MSYKNLTYDFTLLTSREDRRQRIILSKTILREVELREELKIIEIESRNIIMLLD